MASQAGKGLRFCREQSKIITQWPTLVEWMMIVELVSVGVHYSLFIFCRVMYSCHRVYVS